MKKQIYIGILAVVLLAIVIGVWFWKDKGTSEEILLEDGVPGDAVDIVSDFYSDWVSAIESTSTTPYDQGLANDPALSTAMQARLLASREQPETELDPVLCQVELPETIRSKTIFLLENEAQIMVMPKRESPVQTIFTLAMGQVGWLITDIVCASGESMPQGEFSFEREGYLLKSVPEPLDPQYWHLVFEEKGIMGHTVPLFFDASSTCISLEGSEATCNTDIFSDAMKAFVQGEMTESGLNVKRLEIRRDE